MTWPTKKLGEVCKFEGGTQPPKSVFKYKPQERHVRLLQIRDFVSDEKATYVPDSQKLRKCKANDVLIGRYGASVGKILRGKEGAYNVAIIKTIPNEKLLLRDYLYTFLQSPDVQKRFANFTRRAAQAGFTKEEIGSVDIPLPSLREQKRIVRKIEKLFAKIDQAQRLRSESLSASSALLPSALHQIFNSKTKSQKSKLQFKIKKFPEVMEIIMGQSPPSSTYNKSGHGLPFYQGKKDFGEIYPSPSVWCGAPAKITEANDILISVRAPVGPVNISKEKSAIGRGLAALRAKKDKLEYKFLYYYLKHIEDQWAGRGSTFSSISKNDFENQKISLPPVAEQRKIVVYLDSLSAKARELQTLQQQTSADFSALRQSILHSAFAN